MPQRSRGALYLRWCRHIERVFNHDRHVNGKDWYVKGVVEVRVASDHYIPWATHQETTNTPLSQAQFGGFIFFPDRRHAVKLCLPLVVSGGVLKTNLMKG